MFQNNNNVSEWKPFSKQTFKEIENAYNLNRYYSSVVNAHEIFQTNRLAVVFNMKLVCQNLC